MILSSLSDLDLNLFLLINRKWSNSFFDLIMPPIRDKFFWIPLYILIAVLLVIKYKWKSAWVIALLLFNFLLSDQLSSAVLKPYFGRERPCNNDTLVANYDFILRIDACGAGKSFPSSHAANTFAFATLLFLLFRKKYKWAGPVFFFWAFAISYAQVYVGVHYPFDVLFGAVIGIMIALLIYFTALKFIIPRINWEA